MYAIIHIIIQENEMKKSFISFRNVSVSFMKYMLKGYTYTDKLTIIFELSPVENDL